MAARPHPSPLSLVLLALALVLGGGQVAAAADPAAISASPTLRKIRDTGLVTVGYRLSSPPFSYLNLDRQPVGYSVDLCRKVVQAVRQRLEMPDLEVRMMGVSSATRLPLVANGTADLECGVTTHNVERESQVAFSLTIFVASSKLLSRKDAPVLSLDDLRGRPVATTLATTSIQFLQAENRRRGLDMKILAGLYDIEGFRMVTARQAAAYAMDDVLLQSLLAEAPDSADYMIAPTPLTSEPYALVLRKGDPVFKRLVDEVLAGLYRSGEIQAIYAKWFLQPIPPRHINLQLPMSPALQRVIAHPTDSPDPAVYR